MITISTNTWSGETTSDEKQKQESVVLVNSTINSLAGRQISLQTSLSNVLHFYQMQKVVNSTISRQYFGCP